MKTYPIFITILTLCVVLIGGNSHHSAQETTLTTTPNPLPQTARTLQPVIPTETPAPDAPETRQSEPQKAQHMVVVDIDYNAHTVVVQQRVTITNQTDTTWENILFNVEPNRLRGTFALDRINIGQDNFSYTLNQQQLDITFEQPLEPGCEMVIILDYRLVVPAVGEQTLATKGFFGYTERQLNLGHWLATIAPNHNGDWITHATTSIGEQDVLEKADWDVVVNLVNPPGNLTIAAPGQIIPIDDDSWRYVHHDSRDFTLSLSHEFFVVSQIIETGVTIEVYTFGNAHKNNAAEHALELATRSMTMFSDLFGDYPYPRMIIVQGDFPDGMEFSGLAFVGKRWFAQYDGNPAGYLTLITVHEVAHQWWYARVGNDSAINPWLDEALCTYSEYIFLEEYYPNLKDWWWIFRIEQYSPDGYVDSTVYEFETARAYINAVYLRGAQMMQSLRDDLGTEAFFQFLADYSAAGNGKISVPGLFWSQLSAEQLEQTQHTRNQFLRHPVVESEQE